MLLELCKSSVHIMFSDMCPLERERAGEKVRRGWGTETRTGTEGGRGVGWAGAWDWGKGGRGWKAESSCGPGALHREWEGAGRSGTSTFSLFPFLLQTFTPSPLPTLSMTLPVTCPQCLLL